VTVTDLADTLMESSTTYKLSEGSSHVDHILTSEGSQASSLQIEIVPDIINSEQAFLSFVITESDQEAVQPIPVGSFFNLRNTFQDDCEDFRGLDNCILDDDCNKRCVLLACKGRLSSKNLKARSMTVPFEVETIAPITLN
jgi:hypothetical protein